MPSPPEPLPAGPAIGEVKAAPADLDTRILEAERAVIERDERVQLQARQLVERGQDLVDRVHHNLGRVLGIGAAAGTGALLLGWLMPGLRGRGVLRPMEALAPAVLRPGPADGGAGGRRRRHELPWRRILAFAWPLMPLGLRSRVNPRVAAFLMSLGLPLIAKAMRPASDVRTAPYVDLPRYAGRWYEIARTPRHAEGDCTDNVTSDYRLLSGGEDLAVTRRCSARGGRLEAAEGSARVVARSNGAKLEFSFAPPWLRWLPWAWSERWILHVDDDYRHAIVGTPDRRHLWLLSRSPRMSRADFARLAGHAGAQGFDTERLGLTPQAASLH